MSSSPPVTLPLLDLPTPPKVVVSRSVATDPHLPLTPRTIRRFWAQVIRGEGDRCWVWCGAISHPDGYGRFTWQTGGMRRTVSAHRVALMIDQGGELGEGVIGEHGCCEPLCVRVDKAHLWPATQAENIAHAVKLGRHRGNIPVTGSHHRWQRSQMVRESVRGGWDEQAYQLARQMIIVDEDQLALW